MEQMADSFPDQDCKDDACLQGKGWAAPGQKHWDPSAAVQTHCGHSIHFGPPPCQLGGLGGSRERTQT